MPLLNSDRANVELFGTGPAVQVAGRLGFGAAQQPASRHGNGRLTGFSEKNIYMGSGAPQKRYCIFQHFVHQWTLRKPKSYWSARLLDLGEAEHWRPSLLRLFAWIVGNLVLPLARGSGAC
jgi:hypothetical protein